MLERETIVANYPANVANCDDTAPKTPNFFSAEAQACRLSGDRNHALVEIYAEFQALV
jgi:hypothetical protein